MAAARVQGLSEGDERSAPGWLATHKSGVGVGSGARRLAARGGGAAPLWQPMKIAAAQRRALRFKGQKQPRRSRGAGIPTARYCSETNPPPSPQLIADERGS